MKSAAEISENELWELLVRRQGQTFYTSGRKGVAGIPFTYVLRGGEMFVSRKDKSITRATVLMAWRKALAVQAAEGYVAGPKRLGTFGASYLYPIFLALDAIQKTPMNV